MSSSKIKKLTLKTFTNFDQNIEHIGDISQNISQRPKFDIFYHKQAPVRTGMSRARNSRWGMLLYVNEAGIYGGQNKIGVHVY